MTNSQLKTQLLVRGKPPEDKYNVAYIIFFVMGAGVLFSWNSFITAADYFGSLYPNAHIDRTFSLAYIFPELIAVMCVIKYGRRFSPAVRITFGFSAFLAILLVVPLLDVLFIRDDKGTLSTLVVTIALVSAAGTMDALVSGSLYGVAGELPEFFTQAVTAGTGASGLIVSVLRCITKAALPHTKPGVRESAVLYFIIGAAFLAAVLAAYALLRRLPVIRYYEMVKHERESGTETAVRMEDGEIPIAFHQHDPLNVAGSETTMSMTKAGRPLSREPSLDAYFHVPIAPPVLGDADRELQEPVTFTQVFRKIWGFAVLLLLVFEVSLSIFPGFLSEDVHSGALGDWYPVLLITAYNTFDLVGKMVPLFCVIRNDKVIATCVVLRLLFFPAFLLCLHGPSQLGAEWFVFSLTAALGATNGYFTSVLMMLAPKRVEPREAETAGAIMVLFLVAGLAGGALSGWLWLL